MFGWVCYMVLGRAEEQEWAKTVPNEDTANGSLQANAHHNPAFESEHI